MADKEVREEELTEQEGAGKKSGSSMKIVIIVNAVILLLLLIGGVIWFFMSGDDADEASGVDTEVLNEEVEPEVNEAREKKRGAPIYIPLRPAFVVNFENQDKVSFLQVDIQVMTFDPKVEEAIKIHMPRVRNELLLLLGDKQYHEINSREGKRNLSQEAIQEIQRVLEDVGAPSAIEALYFTSFVMQ
jgi:flagellar FliL protein